jgi:hypothetical protein
MGFWLGAYLAVGVMWGLWNSQSRAFQAVTSSANKHGISWTILVGFAIGTLLWPLGAITALILAFRR